MNARPKNSQGAESAYTDLKFRSMAHQMMDVAIYVAATMYSLTGVCDVSPDKRTIWYELTEMTWPKARKNEYSGQSPMRIDRILENRISVKRVIKAGEELTS